VTAAPRDATDTLSWGNDPRCGRRRLTPVPPAILKGSTFVEMILLELYATSTQPVLVDLLA